jgi:hypothetical protein
MTLVAFQTLRLNFPEGQPPRMKAIHQPMQLWRLNVVHGLNLRGLWRVNFGGFIRLREVVVSGSLSTSVRLLALTATLYAVLDAYSYAGA